MMKIMMVVEVITFTISMTLNNIRKKSTERKENVLTYLTKKEGILQINRATKNFHFTTSVTKFKMNKFKS